MNEWRRVVLPLVGVLLVAVPGVASDDPLQTFAKGCVKELTIYCKEVAE